MKLIDKDALVAEIERLVNNYDKALDYEAALEDVRDFIDSLEVKESAELQHVNETCKENGNSLTQEPVSIWHDMSEVKENGRNIIIIDPQNFYGAVLRKGGSQLRNHNRKSFVKWAYIDDLLNLSNVQRTVKNWEEPVSEKLEKAEKFIDEHTKYCSNLAHYEELNGNVWEENTPWLTPDQARKAVEIAREEVIEQMMAKAVGGEVTYGKSLAIPSLGWVLDKERLDYGDKVKLIIIKEN